MKVMIDSSPKTRINSIVVTTFLKGLKAEYGDSLMLMTTVESSVSDTVTKFLDENYSSPIRHHFDMSMILEHDLMRSESGDIGREMVDGHEFDLLIVFGEESMYDFPEAARRKGVPVYTVRKES
jgi:hypothetical protein